MSNNTTYDHEIDDNSNLRNHRITLAVLGAFVPILWGEAVALFHRHHQNHAADQRPVQVRWDSDEEQLHRELNRA